MFPVVRPDLELSVYSLYKHRNYGCHFILPANLCSKRLLDCLISVVARISASLYFVQSSTFPMCLYIPHSSCLTAIFIIASFDRCFFLFVFPYFRNGANLSVIPLISSFKHVPHYVAVMFFSKLFQIIFTRYVLC